LLKVATKACFFEKGTKVFKTDVKSAGGIKWGLYALLIDPKVVAPEGAKEVRFKLPPTHREVKIMPIKTDSSEDESSAEEDVSEGEEEDNPLDPDWELEPPHPQPKFKAHKTNIFDRDWNFWYRRSDAWREAWEDVMDHPEGDWPIDIRLEGGKMYCQQKLCKNSTVSVAT
jgi:hypothetical protein